MFAGLDTGPQGIVARFVGLDGKEKECMLPHDARNRLNHVRNRREGKRGVLAYGGEATRFGLHSAPTAAVIPRPSQPRREEFCHSRQDSAAAIAYNCGVGACIRHAAEGQVGEVRYDLSTIGVDGLPRVPS